jgi:hypothetical protein
MLVSQTDHIYNLIVPVSLGMAVLWIQQMFGYNDICVVSLMMNNLKQKMSGSVFLSGTVKNVLSLLAQQTNTPRI